MNIPDADLLKISITNHAFKRFRERIDPTATFEQIEEYVRQSEIKYNFGFIERYGLPKTLQKQGKMRLHYKHVVFVVAKSKDKGRYAVNVVTVLRLNSHDEY
jgi:hypothetical protein